jgi:hypothetical protein
MMVRDKSGEMQIWSGAVLLEFLGVKQEAAGRQAVKADVELIASVPFKLAVSNE